jgi:hypothetical protein
MTSPNLSDTLADRVAISDVVVAYATALDTRRWPLLRSILTDPIAIDYTSYDPSLDLVMPADEWVRRVSWLRGFHATQHLSTNHVHSIEGDQATCVSYMHAGHFFDKGGESHLCTLFGHYTNRLQRTSDGWKIAKCTLTITARQGDERVFAWALARSETMDGGHG